MDESKKLKVQVQKDHLSKVAAGKPKTGLTELIWNALDADATHVAVNFNEGEVGIDKVIIADNGTGIDYKEAEELFIRLGGSWKSNKQRTESGRFLHGQEGQGRFKAFTIGRVADWKVVYQKGGEFFEFTISGRADAIDEFVLSPNLKSEKKQTGVTVEISEISKKFHILTQEKALEELAPIFAVYLKNYSAIELRFNGSILDITSLIKSSTSLDIEPLIIDGIKNEVIIDIVEWNEITEREILFADSKGFPLESFDKIIRGVGENGFSAYIKSDYFRELNTKGLLSLRDLESSISDCCEIAVKAIKDHFFSRELEKAKSKIDEWKEQEIYPFKGNPNTAIEVAERKVFDIVAVNINKSLPDFESSEKVSKEFQLAMLKQAIEKSPQDLQTIMTQVLRLPRSTREDLAELLQDTTLSALINTSKIVSDRIKFLAGLEQLVFNHKSNLKERSQLHQLLAKNTWVFGEAFALTVNDQSLTEVLRKHSKFLTENLVIDDPVKRIDGRRGIVDLMLSKQISRNRKNELEHLVIELKAPKLRIGGKEIDQIESYANAVAKDERFRNLEVKWNFWLVSNDFGEKAKFRLDGTNDGPGIIYKSTSGLDITIWIKTWSELITENKHRLQFLRDKLDHNVTAESAIKYLQSTYSEYIDGVVIEENEPD